MNVLQQVEALVGDDPVLDTLTFTAAQVPAAVAGGILGLIYSYGDVPGQTAGWTPWATLDPASPPAVPLGKILALGIGWVNNGNVNVKGHIDLVVTKPDGSKETPTAYEGQDYVAAPGSGVSVAFRVTLDKVGSYSATATLSG